MFTFITSYFYNTTEELPEPTDEEKRNRYNVLKEIKQFDKSILLSRIECSIDNKKKIFTFKRRWKKKRKKNSSTS